MNIKSFSVLLPLLMVLILGSNHAQATISQTSIHSLELANPTLKSAVLGLIGRIKTFLNGLDDQAGVVPKMIDRLNKIARTTEEHAPSGLNMLNGFVKNELSGFLTHRVYLFNIKRLANKHGVTLF